MVLEIFSRCRLHFGELIQIALSDSKRICISNVLDSNYMHPFIKSILSSSEAALYLEYDDQNSIDIGCKLYKFGRDWRKKENSTKSMCVINKILASTDYFGKICFYTNNAHLEGSGMGSSTADIINAIRCAHILLGEKYSTSTINHYLRQGEKASDPLHLNKVIYNTVSREIDESFSVSNIPNYLIISIKGKGHNPIITDNMIYCYTSQEESEHLFSLICNKNGLRQDEYIKNIKKVSAISLDKAQKWLKNPDYELVKNVAKMFDLGITGSHSGNVLGVTLWNGQIDDYDLHAKIKNYIIFLYPDAEVAIGKCT